MLGEKHETEVDEVGSGTKRGRAAAAELAVWDRI